MQRRKNAGKLMLIVLSCAVALGTTLALVLPGITLEKQCQLQEHTHTEDCYAQPAEEAQRTLACAAQAHQHTEDCYDADGALVCGMADYLIHTHSDDCYDAQGELACPLDEHEGTPHTHDENCYQLQDVLTCGLEESDEHTHVDTCYSQIQILTCEELAVSEHVHDESCFVTEQAEAELICGLEAHTHTEECNIPVELTEEEQAQVDEVIALIDALPAQEEIGETLAAFEDDEDGYDAYLTEIIAQAKTAYEAYSGLTEAQQGQVTNADRLLALEPLWSMQTLETNYPALTDDSAYVTGITVDSISDGTAPFDANDNAGNDSGTTNRIVRTFDTVTYNFTVTMDSYESGIYSEARVKLEFVLPLTADQATFDQGAMAWMDQAESYAPVLTTETRTIDGKETQCQVLTCYKQLLPSEGHASVVPGSFGENVTVNVKSLKNGDTFAPIFSACMEYGTWEGNCPTHNLTEKATVVADKVTVSAAPKYNIQISGSSSYKSTFNFDSGNIIAQTYGDGYNRGNVTGRVIKVGVMLQLYNDDATKGLKGIELPDGNDITLDLQVSSAYTINTPNDGGSYTQGTKVNTTSTYLPLLWSCDGNKQTLHGYTNSDGRVLYDSSHGCIVNGVPYVSGGGSNACYNGGTWMATQTDNTIHVTVSGYQIDVDQMPTKDAAGRAANYGADVGIGVFSAGEIWIVQPYNKTDEDSDSQESQFDVITDYGQGAFTTSVQAINMKVTAVSGTIVADTKGTNNAQMITNDDSFAATVELVAQPGVLLNRVAYADPTNYNKGVGVVSYQDGLDFATLETEIGLLGGFSYQHRSEEDNVLYWGTNLTKFYASAIEIIDSVPGTKFTGGASPAECTVYYATKKDGTDWGSDSELQHTYEDDMVFYKNLSDIPTGHLCVGLLFCFKEDTFSSTNGEEYFFECQKAKVRDDMSLVGNTYMLASTSRVWTKSMFEQAGMALDDIPDWSELNTSLNSFPAGYYSSGNITGSVFYIKETYAADGSGALGTHNSSWRHWGDTLLVIGYKTGITKTLCQTSDDDTTKTTYNLDAEQRVVDFKLQPRTYYDQVSGINNLTTTVTIVDTLPKYLTYRPGSSYFGGTYEQTSTNGGTQGTITGGTLKEPTVTNNADGTQTLTWVITDVTVGETMPAIYYSANIGDRNNPDEDVPTGTTDLVNKVRITATHDIRQPTLANGNYAEVGIAVTRGAASSYGKYSKQDVVEADGQIDYVIYYDNNAVTEATKPVLVDAMPVNSVLGSNFTGTWEITSFKISLVGADTNTTLKDLDASLHYTMDSEYAGQNLAYLQANQVNPNENWEDAAIDENGYAKTLEGTAPVMWVLNCESLPGNSELRVEYTIELIPEAGSTLDNIKYVNQFSTSNTTTTTETLVVKRTLEGLTWLDDNGDGIQDEDANRRISGVKVELLKLKDDGTAGNEADYEPYCYPDTNTPIAIETGQQISVRASDSSDATTYEPGRYKFTDLPAGTFAVRFTDGNTTKISPLLASPSNLGKDDTKDSDGIATYADANKSSLSYTMITGIDMPAAENMSVTLYESKNHDSGFYEKGHELPMTGGGGTALYTIGGLLLTGAGLLLVQRQKRRKKARFAP